jgi:pre-rRNA-processing protein IPI3
LVGTSTGIIQVYDIPSHQLLRTISSSKDKGLSITYLASLLKPPDLIGHISLNVGDTRGGIDAIPVKPILPFQRMKDAKNRESHEVSVLLPVQDTVCAQRDVGSIWNVD